MKISTILDHIDSGHMALPEFQRGYVWSRNQVRGLFESLYSGHPVGGLLLWATEAKSATYRGEGDLAAGIVKLLLDGQQRLTSIYGVVRGKPPEFFDGNARAFTDLRFHVEDEEFGFYQPIKMRDDPRWINVTELLNQRATFIGTFMGEFSQKPEFTAEKISNWISRLSRLQGILDIDLHAEEVTGSDKTLDVVVDIFNRVNSGGTKLSKGDLALAKICAEWHEGRDEMKANLAEWERAGYQFSLDWLLRSVNTVLTGEAKFHHLHNRHVDEISEALKRACKHIDTCLNVISGRLGLDHDQVLLGKFAVPVMVRYLDRRPSGLGSMNEIERDKLLFWFVQAAMWGRFSGSTETFIDQDLQVLEGEDGDLDRLLGQLLTWRGGLRVAPDNFRAWGRGSRFYSVLYMITRMAEARDWGTGLPLKANLHGRGSKLEVHHIFPKARLNKAEMKFEKAEVNALGNFCFLTKDTNLKISDRFPDEYFPEVEAAHPGALASQWIPQDPNLWKIENYREFLAERQKLLATEVNKQLSNLLHGDTSWLDGEVPLSSEPEQVASNFSNEEEEQQLKELNDWVASIGLARGELSFDYADELSGEQIATFDLAWPGGLQEGLSSPVAVLLNEPAETIATASQAGYRCFTDAGRFRAYVQQEVLGGNLDE